MTRPGRSPLRAWLDLARAGNLPSVWSNVLAALVLSAPVTDVVRTADAWPSPTTWLLATLFGSLAYAGGAMLNDVADADIDRRLKPTRAIPTGRVARTTAGGVGLVLLGASVVLFVYVLGASPWWAGGMAAAILSYNWLHKRWAGSVVLMAACRGLLGFTVASVAGHTVSPAVLAWGAALSTYIIVLSLIARAEHRAGARAPALGRLVGRLLAGMPLVDAAALVAVGAWPAALACAAAVPIGRLAQRLFAST